MDPLQIQSYIQIGMSFILILGLCAYAVKSLQDKINPVTSPATLEEEPEQEAANDPDEPEPVVSEPSEPAPGTVGEPVVEPEPAVTEPEQEAAKGPSVADLIAQIEAFEKETGVDILSIPEDLKRQKNQVQYVQGKMKELNPDLKETLTKAYHGVLLLEKFNALNEAA